MAFTRLLPSLTLLALILLPVMSGLTLLRLEPGEINIVRGEIGIVQVHVGEDLPDIDVRLEIAEPSAWFEFTFSPEVAETPYTSILSIKVSPETPPGDYLVGIDALSDGEVLDTVFLRIKVLSGFQPPVMAFTQLTCPRTGIVGERLTLDLTFTYSAAQETNGRILVLVDNEIKTSIEFTFSGEGTMPFQAHITAPLSPGEIIVETILQYYNPDTEEWETADTGGCAGTIEPIPTTMTVKVTGLPSNLSSLIQVIILPQGTYLEEEVHGGGRVNFSLPLVEPSTVLVTAQESVEFSETVKYVVEDRVRQLLVKPGWSLQLEFRYSPWYLLRKRVEPEDDVLRILEGGEWFREGEEVNLTVPKALQSSSTMFLLTEVRVDGEPYHGKLLSMNSPHTISYKYKRYYRLVIELEPGTLLLQPSSVMPARLAEVLGEFWVEEGDEIFLPFRGFEAGGLLYTPTSVETELEYQFKDEGLAVKVAEPGKVRLKYLIDAKLRVETIYIGGHTEAEEYWIPLGGKYEVDLDKLTAPTWVGERIEISEISSNLSIQYDRERKVLRVTVTEPGKVEVRLKRYFLIRNLGVIGVPGIGLECSCPPGMCRWVSEEGELRAWAPEGTSLTCYFPERVEAEDVVADFLRGHLGELVVDEPGQKSIYIHAPIKVYMNAKVMRLYRLEGKTELGVFIGEGVYKEGERAPWRVEPQEVSADGVLGILGFRWRAINPYGVEVMDGDRVVEVRWELAMPSDNPLIVFLEAAAIGFLSLTAWEYHKRWKLGMRRESWIGKEE